MIAAMYIRKQNIFTEKKIYPYAKLDDLRLDLFPRIRQAAANHAMGRHPWQDMDDMALLRSAGLYGTDIATGETGFNLAAILLLGRDEVIQNVCPTYETDALVRKINLDRYDDRETIRTNLIESYDLLMDFAKKHLPDKFFLEGVDRVSLRDVLVREMVSNTLMHREFVSSYTAKFVIMQDRMYTENANRAVKDGPITLENLEPTSKNPIIATFFRNIGRADRLGSGVRNLFKYSRFYSGSDPQFREGDVFRIIVPLNEAYSYDYKLGQERPDTVDTNFDTIDTIDTIPTFDLVSRNLTTEENVVLELLTRDAALTQKQVQNTTGYSLSTVKRIMARLQKEGVITRIGNNRSGKWQVNG